MNSFDIAIVGAGPAGSAAAIALARRGYSVALIDKEKFPRDKLCGDFLNPSNWPMLEQLGVSRQLFMQNHEVVTSFRFTAVNGALAEAGFLGSDGTPIHGLGLRRIFFDQILVDQAQADGVTLLLGSRVKSLLRQANGVWRFGCGDSSDEMSARVLVGADGRNSWVAHHLGAAGNVSRAGGRVGFQLRLRAPVDLSGRVEIHLFPGGYAGVLGLGDGTVNLCMAVKRPRSGSHISVDNLLESYLPRNPHLKTLLRQSEPLWPARAAYPVYFPPRRAVGEGLILIGDAARVNEPVSGEGVYFALRSGLIGADVIDRALARGDLSAQELAEYERRCRAEFRLRRGLNAAIRFLMYRPVLLKPLIGMTSISRQPLQSLVHAICQPEAVG